MKLTLWDANRNKKIQVVQYSQAAIERIT
jgi:hypothetical protein